MLSMSVIDSSSGQGNVEHQRQYNPILETLNGNGCIRSNHEKIIIKNVDDGQFSTTINDASTPPL